MNKNHLYKGSLATIILKILADEGRMYGYEISKRAKELTAGDLSITEGALYPTLHKLESEGVLMVEMEMVGNRPRKYYSLTENGRREAVDRIKELLEHAGKIQTMLKGGLAHG